MSIDFLKVGLENPTEEDWDPLQLLHQGAQYLRLPAHQVLPADTWHPKLFESFHDNFLKEK